MQFTKSQLVRLSELNVQLHTCREQIERIKATMNQLLEHECKIQITITVYDTTVAEEAKSQETVNNLIDNKSFVEFLNGFNKIPKENKATTHLFHHPENQTSIRILHAIFKERKELEEEYVKEIESIILSGTTKELGKI